jgi:hypothetical protein
MLERNIERLERLRQKVEQNPVLAKHFETSITTLGRLLETERRLESLVRRLR